PGDVAGGVAGGPQGGDLLGGGRGGRLAVLVVGGQRGDGRRDARADPAGDLVGQRPGGVAADDDLAGGDVEPHRVDRAEDPLCLAVADQHAIQRGRRNVAALVPLDVEPDQLGPDVLVDVDAVLVALDPLASADG